MMFILFLFIIGCLSRFTGAYAFMCASSGQEATRGKMGGTNPEIPHPRTSLYLVSNREEGNDHIIDDTDSALTERNQYFDVLQDAINLNSTEASSVLLSRITEIRQSGEYTTGEQEDFLNNLLALGPDARLPIWTIVRPLTRFSRRARMRSLRRTLDQITPDADRKDDSIEGQLQRRRRALVSLLRSLSDDEADNSNEIERKQGIVMKRSRPAIVSLQKRAIQASKVTTLDLTSRRPEGLETPEYDVIASGKDTSNRMAENIEIRSYQPYSVCTVSMVKPRPIKSSKTDQKLGSPESGGASSFGALAGYLFGKNDQSTAMKMTTPVFTTNPGEVSSKINRQEDQRMEFVMPSNYWGSRNLLKAPMPLESSGVVLQERESETRAVLMFGGYASKKEAEKRKKRLLSTFSKRDSKWRPVEETLSLAQYNDPFTVPWRRLNEVSIKVENR